MLLSGPLVVREVTKRFGRQVAVDRASFRVDGGRITGLLGPNGSGKSTIIHCITGFHSPTAGQVWIDGHPHHEPAAKDAFGFFPDDLPVPEALTASETLAFHRRLRPRFDQDFARELVQILGLTPSLRKFVGEYSHGMRRKLQLVLALAHHPGLLILDEPLRGLDPEAGALMTAVISEFTQLGGAALMATHDLHAAEGFCDDVVIVSAGEIVATGTPADVVHRAEVRDLEEAFVRITGLSERVTVARSAVSDLLNKRGAAPQKSFQRS
ncbi:MAG: ABC transporter ATP-binding protein [Dermatophilaceae bacterium]